MTEIELLDVNKSYDGTNLAVEELSLTIEPGSFVCLLGPSGCGKTTTLRMISGLERLDSGTLRVGGKDFDNPAKGVFRRPEGRDLGLVFQSYALWPHMTVEENVAFGLRMRGDAKTAREQAIASALELLRMSPYRKRYPAELSGGQQQRVALARMLAVEPSVLLLDEPLSNLDAALRLEMRSELKRLHARLGNTIVFVTHDQLEAMSLATHIAVMNDGRLEQYDSPMNVYHTPATAFVAEFVGSPPMNMVSFDTEKPENWLQDFRSRLAKSSNVPSDRIHTVGFRPEDANLIFQNQKSVPGSQGQEDWTSEVVVDAVLPTGPEIVVSVKLHGRQMYLVLDPEETIEAGQAATLAVPYRKIHLFDTDGLRLENESVVRSAV